MAPKHGLEFKQYGWEKYGLLGRLIISSQLSFQIKISHRQKLMISYTKIIIVFSYLLTMLIEISLSSDFLVWNVTRVYLYLLTQPTLILNNTIWIAFEHINFKKMLINTLKTMINLWLVRCLTYISRTIPLELRIWWVKLGSTRSKSVI